MNEHTPAPWECDLFIAEGTFVVYAPSGWVICERNSVKHRAAESSANGRLIAAAPDLLAILRRAESHFRTLPPEYDDPGSLMAEMRAVIARAEGR